MYIYLEVIDVVANAFIGILKMDRKSILYKELDAYGAKVVEILNKDENTNAVYISSRESKMSIFEDYSEYFDEYQDNEGYKGIVLKEGKTREDLWSAFCVSMSLRVLDAFMEANRINEKVAVG